MDLPHDFYAGPAKSPDSFRMAGTELAIQAADGLHVQNVGIDGRSLGSEYAVF